MLRIWKIRNLLVALALGALLAVARAAAQEDANETSLGDVARSLRKKTSNRPVIDDDNLPEAMQQANSERGWGSSLRSLMPGEGSLYRVSAPDVTCNLSFSSDVKSLLSKQYSEMAMPESDLEKLEGHASIGDDALNVAVHNGTDWHVSEIAVAFTVLKKNASPLSPSKGPGDDAPPVSGLEADKKPDTTVLYRMRAVGVPWAVTTFSSRLQSELEPASEWHWAIVEARGYPPESYRRRVTQEGNAGQDETARTDEVPKQNLPTTKTGEVTPVSNSGAEKPQLVPAVNPQ